MAIRVKETDRREACRGVKARSAYMRCEIARIKTPIRKSESNESLLALPSRRMVCEANRLNRNN